MPLTTLMVVSAVTMFALMKLFSPIARRLDLVDRPDLVRKFHDGEVPLTGGPALLGTMLVATLMAPSAVSVNGWLLAVAALTAAIGMIDDRIELSALVRLFAQLMLSAMLVSVTGLSILDLGDLFGRGEPYVLGSAGGVVTVLALTAAMNAFNMLDGTDGQASGIALVLAGALVIGALLSGSAVLLVPLVACAALPVFMAYSLPARRAFIPKSFLGDSGALMLGLALGASLIESAHGASPWLESIHALWFAAIPIFDTFFVMAYRLAHGRSPLSADRNHIHHLLRDHGIGKSRQLAVILAAATMLAGLGVLQSVFATPVAASLLAYIVFFVMYCTFAVQLHRRRPVAAMPPAV